nr:MAG TPA: hypothetical protein [Caudoviricetes sp.]
MALVFDACARTFPKEKVSDVNTFPKEYALNREKLGFYPTPFLFIKMMDTLLHGRDFVMPKDGRFGSTPGSCNVLSLGLLTTMPDENGRGFTEVKSSGSSYERICLFPSTFIQSKDYPDYYVNNQLLMFDAPFLRGKSWGEVVGVGIWDKQSGGNLLLTAKLSSSFVIEGNADAYGFAEGSLFISSNCLQQDLAAFETLITGSTKKKDKAIEEAAIANISSLALEDEEKTIIKIEDKNETVAKKTMSRSAKKRAEEEKMMALGKKTLKRKKKKNVRKIK